jgi:hypothetical protein
MSGAVDAKRVNEIKIALSDGKHCDIRFRTLAQCSEAIRESERPGGVSCRTLNNLIERQSHVHELRKRSDQVKHRTVHVELMYIARNGSGQEVLLQRVFGNIE